MTTGQGRDTSGGQGLGQEPRTEHTTRLDLPLLLPEVKDLRDTCVERLLRLLGRRTGVRCAHVVGPGEEACVGAQPDEPMPSVEPGESELCLHYDPDRLTLAQITALARAAPNREEG